LEICQYSFYQTVSNVSISKNFTWQPMAIMLLSLAVSVVKTEQEVNKNFDADGNKI